MEGSILVSLRELISEWLPEAAAPLVVVVARAVVDAVEDPPWPRRDPGGCWEQRPGEGGAVQAVRQPGELGMGHEDPVADDVSAAEMAWHPDCPV